MYVYRLHERRLDGITEVLSSYLYFADDVHSICFPVRLQYLEVSVLMLNRAMETHESF